MTTFYQPLGASELLPRYAYLEALLPGRRVLEVGALGSTRGKSAAFLRAKGAKHVLALDADPDLVEEVRRAWASDPDLSFRAGRVEDLGEEERFDLILVADAAPLVRVPSTLDRVAKLLSADGFLVLGLRHSAGVSLASLVSEEPREATPTFGELREALAARFKCVEAATQSAFVGYRLSPLAAGAVETSVDATLVGPEECGYFLAICGQRPSGVLSGEAIVELPAAPLAVASTRYQELADRLRLAEDDLAAERARAQKKDG